LFTVFNVSIVFNSFDVFIELVEFTLSHLFTVFNVSIVFNLFDVFIELVEFTLVIKSNKLSVFNSYNQFNSPSYILSEEHIIALKN